MTPEELQSRPGENQVDDSIIEEPTIGQPVSSTPSQSEEPSAVRNIYDAAKENVQEKLAERRAAQAAAKKAAIHEAESLAAKKAATTAATEIVAKGAATKAAAAAGGALAGPVGWVASAAAIASTIYDGAKLAMQNEGIRRVVFGIGLVFLSIAFFLLLIMASLGGQVNHFGPGLGGGTALTPLDDPLIAAAGSQQKGLAATLSVDELDKQRELISKQLAKTSLSADKKSKITQLLTQAHDLRLKMKSSAYAADQSQMAQSVTQYRDIMKQIFDVMYPGAAGVREKIKALSAAGAIRYAGTLERNDIESSPAITPTLLNAIASLGEDAKAKNYSIIICSVKSDHNRKTNSGNVSDHFLGRAIDICGPYIPGTSTLKPDFAKTVLTYLRDNHKQLKVHELIFNAPTGDGKPSGAYNIDSGNINAGTFAGDHLDHIHMGVLP